VGDEDLAFAGLARQAELVRAAAVSPRELVELYLARIERLDPKLNAYRVVMAEQALADADEAERRRAAGASGPLLGVPIAVKDCHDVAGQITTHGTACFDEPASADSEMVRRLRAAGAIVIGKTNLPELAAYGFTESDAWGITRNPWDRERTPSGSSGGSGAAVAAGLAAAATASDGAGSIRGPAAFSHLFGLKPQRGRISLAPDREHWHGLSVGGCLTRSVIDTALWLDVTAGAVEGDVDAAPPPERPFVEAARRVPGKLRVAASVKPPRALAPPVVSDEVKGAVRHAAQLLGSLGHEVGWRDPSWGLMGNQMTPLYVNGIHQDFRKLPHPERAMGQTRGMARVGGLYPGPVISRAKRVRAKCAARVNRIFDDHDVFLTCVAGLPPFEVGRWAGRNGLQCLLGMSRVYPFNIAWNYLGNPAASVPMGFTPERLPLAVQIVGRPNDEATVLSLAAQIEAERPWAQERPPLS
jgi:amidase